MMKKLSKKDLKNLIQESIVSEQVTPGSRPWGGFSDRWRHGSGFDSDTEESPPSSTASAPSKSHEAKFFMGSIDVSSGLRSMIEGLKEIDDPKIQNSFRRLLVEMQTKVKSISDAYTKVIGQQAESGWRE